MTPRLLPLALALLLAGPLAAQAPDIPPPQDVPYPGTIRVEVDATDLAHRIFRVKQTIPVQPGSLTLLYPKWVPGGHSPRNPIDKIAGITFKANGQTLDWKRDPLDVNAFHLQVPAGVQTLTAEFDYLTPTNGSQGRVVMTPNMLNLQFLATVLYPAGHYAHRIMIDPRVTYPAGWTAFTALDEEGRSGNTVDYKDVPLDIFVDSPVYAGRYAKNIDLTPAGSRVPVKLGVVADAPKYLEATPKQIALHKALVEQALKLFGAQHYDHYQFLFSLSDQMGGNGLEHQRSSENGVEPDYFTGWNEKIGFTDLLAHEYTHSWNGKYRRPADLWTPNFNVPMQDSLLWVYEGQTQYWGNVLAARSGLRPLPASIDALALVVATYAENRPGLSWRNIQDTTNDPIIANRAPRAYRNYQMSEDYYSGGQMIWLEADALIRSRSGGKKSLDDFAKAFFGVNDGEWEQQNTYTFDDVVATLNKVLPYDWATFLRERLDGKKGLTGGIEAAGWRLVFKDTPSAYAKANARWGGADFVYSLGLSLGKDGTVSDVRWDSPAFNAGIGSGATVVAVNGQAFSPDVLADAVKANTDGKAPIALLVKEFDRYRTVTIDYRGGLRYPHLERIPGTPDYLTAILSPRK
ncbi:M61 family metallopeptidase [Thermomonas hydrothermalis]|uniref:Predicted metalloprotease, contains C-terminal PDZ domain n=1 Tax=Thermomonas hydrothermalis TaxID=213588 RepID=A0A1M4TYF8_9GAMM|nr:M61 family metallopeptidase [Thermomonas hydrothermalis]SHE49542.1 Predicted metalloprotease, contains C-terminal PDZ domain [Thermomonas hydrothermalis]